mmetsp:Transcript_17525/g.35622  ORF Transcript_17525/g.35622 Transcript_17525/m.35622 type:complete len:213 (-) Transcript_17525:891-1529(-)
MPQACAVLNLPVRLVPLDALFHFLLAHVDDLERPALDVDLAQVLEPPSRVNSAVEVRPPAHLAVVRHEAALTLGADGGCDVRGEGGRAVARILGAREGHQRRDLSHGVVEAGHVLPSAAHGAGVGGVRVDDGLEVRPMCVQANVEVDLRGRLLLAGERSAVHLAYDHVAEGHTGVVDAGGLDGHEVVAGDAGGDVPVRAHDKAGVEYVLARG